MEPAEEQMMVIVYIKEGWYIVAYGSFEVLAGPYETHEDAVDQVRTRAYRIKQGWAP